MITLFGATGYTGRLIAQELSRRDLQEDDLRLAGRSAEKLKELSASLPGAPPWLVADAYHPQSLKALFEGTIVLVNCVGPFTDMGESVLSLAALNGVHYLDITNELGYVHRVQGYDSLARKSGAAVVPACAFEVALADCALTLLAKKFLGTLDRVDVVYALSGQGSSLGTRRSAIRSLGTSWLGYRGGNWVGAVPCREVQEVDLPHGNRFVLSFPSSEITILPRHLQVREIKTWMGIPRGARHFAPYLLPIIAWLSRSPAGRLVEGISTLISRPGKGNIRDQAPFTVLVEARQGNRSQSITIGGGGVYEITAKIAAYAARKMARPGYDQAGVLPPALAFEPEEVIRVAEEEWGLEIIS
jgi:short subunit dehydrogenase-like uncharacterized protein